MSLLVPPSSPVESLEQGRVIFYPQCPFPLPPADDLAFMRDEMPKRLKRKNVSYYPEADRVAGVADPRVHDILKQHSQRVRAFLEKEIAPLARHWRVGTSSFRPFQEKGRKLSAHASNELVHVDAGAYGATHGGSVLRFFINVNPSEDRVWMSKGPFVDVFTRVGKAAGVVGLNLKEMPWDKARTGVLNGIGKLVPAAKMIDSSPYDRAMRKLHNYMKDTPAFQSSVEGHEEFRFPPFSAWMTMTDRVSHAAVSGQHAFIDTFIIEPESFTRPELSPLQIMQRA